MVELNRYVFICMEHISDDREKSSCAKIPIADEDFVWEYGVVYKKGKKLNHSARLFLDFLSQNLP